MAWIDLFLQGVVYGAGWIVGVGAVIAGAIAVLVRATLPPWNRGDDR